MIKATASTVRGRQLHKAISLFVHNLDIACDRLSAVGSSPGPGPGPETLGPVERWQDDTLLSFSARTMFDAIFNTVFGRDEHAPFNSQLAYRNFQARVLLCHSTSLNAERPGPFITKQPYSCRTLL